MVSFNQNPSLSDLQEQRSEQVKGGSIAAVKVLDNKIMDSNEYQKIKSSQTEGEIVSFSNVQIALIESLDSVFKGLPELCDLEKNFLPIYFNAEDLEYLVDVEKGKLSSEIVTSKSILSMYKMVFLYQKPGDSWLYLLKDKELYLPLKNFIHEISSKYRDDPVICTRKLLEKVFSVSAFENIDEKVESIKKLYYKKG